MIIDTFPRMLAVRQKFPAAPPLDLRAVLRQEFAHLQPRLKPGARIAVGVGSRGIDNLQAIVATVLELLKAAGAQPFIVPAMGSHGGATPEGQTEILAGYGITEAQIHAPIHAAMDATRVGATDDGQEVVFSAEALKADGILVINRVKPHTDFVSDSLGSGLLKMLVVGLGKHAGAANYHRAAVRQGFEAALRKIAPVVLRSVPVLGGVGIVENQRHQTVRLAIFSRGELERGEAELFAEASRLMPKLPFDEIDLLIVDRLGKNISGSGMDPNIIGREIHGYSTLFAEQRHYRPAVGRLFVRDLTPETRGNAIGLGLADFTTTRLVRAMDPQKTYVNSLTSLSLNAAKIPIHFETDREAIAQALRSLALPDTRQAKVVRMADTLSLERLEVSEACAALARQQGTLEVEGQAEEMRFDAKGNLI